MEDLNEMDRSLKSKKKNQFYCSARNNFFLCVSNYVVQVDLHVFFNTKLSIVYWKPSYNRSIQLPVVMLPYLKNNFPNILLVRHF